MDTLGPLLGHMLEADCLCNGGGKRVGDGLETPWPLGVPDAWDLPSVPEWTGTRLRRGRKLGTVSL